MLKVDQAAGGGINRRKLMAWGGGTALALVLGQMALARTPLTTAEFAALSGRLLERSPDVLDADHAADYLAALNEQGQQDALAALFDGAPDPVLEQRILSDWYSGVHQAADGERLVTYTEALIWDALDYTKPQGWCGGETGYWADAPMEA